MKQYIDKADVLAEIERLSAYLDSFHEQRIIEKILSIIDTLEVKEVDFEKEVHSQMDLLCNLLSYMDELSNGDSEGVYPLPTNVNEDLQRFAKHFFELGLKAQKG